MTVVTMKISDWLQIVRGQYLEMPGVALTRSEIQRMWSLDDTTCDALLDALVLGQFLRLTHRNRYVRAGSGSGVT